MGAFASILLGLGMAYWLAWGFTARRLPNLTLSKAPTPNDAAIAPDVARSEEKTADARQALAYEGDLEPGARPSQKSPDQQEPALPKQPELPTIGQLAITNAMYDAIAGTDPYKLQAILEVMPRLDPVIQTYCAAALIAAKPRIEQLQQAIRDTISTFAEIEKKVQEFNNGLSGIVNGITEIAGSLAGGYGGVITGLAKLGGGITSLAISGEMKTADYLKSRISDLGWLRDWEGSDTYKGIRLQRENGGFYRIRRRVQADPMCDSLPEVNAGAQFWFAPSLEQFQDVGIKSGLYSAGRFSEKTGIPAAEIWARPEELRPVDAYQVQDYTLGYAQAQNGIEQDGEAPFYVLGRADAITNKSSQVQSALGLWAQEKLGNA